MPNGPQKLILIRAGRYEYAEVEVSGTLQIVGPNNTGKTTLINTLQFLYLDDQRQMDFGHSLDETKTYYFPDQYSYVLFECLGARGKFVLGWRGQSRASGGDPERFVFEGPFDSTDFIQEDQGVREPKDVSARLSVKHYTSIKNNSEHRELLLQATRGDSKGTGIVALRDNSQYPHFRETLKDLLRLSSITQDQMRNRLLMLANLRTDKPALDVRQMFGESYDRLLDRKAALVQFRKHKTPIESLVDLSESRQVTRGELMFRWTDMRAKKEAFEHEHIAAIKGFETQRQEEQEKLRTLTGQLAELRRESASLSETKGGLQSKLDDLSQKAKEFASFSEDLERAALENLSREISVHTAQLENASHETREDAVRKIQGHEREAMRLKEVINQFDDALVTTLRGELNDDDLSILARLFNADLLRQRVGEGSIILKQRDEFIDVLRAFAQRVEGSVYRDQRVEMPLPEARMPFADLADVEVAKCELEDAKKAIERWRQILNTVLEREEIRRQLSSKREAERDLAKRLALFESFQKEKSREPQIKASLGDTLKAIGNVNQKIEGLEEAKGTVSKSIATASDSLRNKQQSYRQTMDDFAKCNWEDFKSKPREPDAAIPNDFDMAVKLFLRQQSELNKLNTHVREDLGKLVAVLGDSYSGSDEEDTIRRIREQLEALPEQEQVLAKDWEHQFHELKATFGQVLQDIGDIKSAADKLNKALSRVQVSNLRSLKLDVIEEEDHLSHLRSLSDQKQPDLFNATSGVEKAIEAFRTRLQNSPLLRYSDLFTLRFTVAGEDGKPHHYHEFKQVESTGTTITIKVLFSLLVLRSLLREDSNKGLICEVPFFLDEIHSLDPVNRYAVLTTARKLGFTAITAAPDSISEVDALYFIQSKNGRIVLRQRHRIGVKTTKPTS